MRVDEERTPELHKEKADFILWVLTWLLQVKATDSFSLVDEYHFSCCYAGHMHPNNGLCSLLLTGKRIFLSCSLAGPQTLCIVYSRGKGALKDLWPVHTFELLN